MIKCLFICAEALTDSIGVIANEIGLSPVNEDFDVSVFVIRGDDDEISVDLSSKEAKIVYGGGKARFFRALAILAKWLREGVSKRKISEKPLFATNGPMIDLSRNAVMTLETLKYMIRKSVLMGLNTFYLYIEDNYEISGREFFGHMRGRYSKEELRELDAYAANLGVELIPCIQVLGHLTTHLRWKQSQKYRDTARVLLVGEEETYLLIEDMIATAKECFSTRRVHIGMDETHDLGTGSYLDRNSYRKSEDLYLEHLTRVVKIVEKYGLKPMMWSDMFFELAGGRGCPTYYPGIVMTESIASRVPKGVQQVFWDYYNPDESFYSINLEKHKMLGENTLFAGGIWTWSGFCPHFSRSLRHTVPALDACKKAGVREVMATIWHNGSECSLVLSLAGLAWYADYDYRGYYDEQGVRDCFEAALPESKYDDFMLAELPELPHGGEVCISRALVYNDPLLGIMDAHIKPYDMMGSYKEICEKIADIGGNDEFFRPAFSLIKLVSDLLYNKADFGVRLKSAYDEGNTAALRALAEECGVIIEKINALRIVHRESWFKYNKPIGWEVHDVRYGGMIMRFETVAERINEYLNGKISSIEELSADRLRYDGRTDGPSFDHRFLWLGYSTLATVNRL